MLDNTGQVGGASGEGRRLRERKHDAVDGNKQTSVSKPVVGRAQWV